MGEFKTNCDIIPIDAQFHLITIYTENVMSVSVTSL